MMLTHCKAFQGSVRVSQTQQSHTTSRPVRAFVPVIVAKQKTRHATRVDRHERIRKKLSGTTERPRLAVFRSNNHIYVQVIDDSQGFTLASANTLQKELSTPFEGKCATVEAAAAVGKKIAELCLAKGIEKVAFDRGGFMYHGRVKAIAEGAREGGLTF